MKVLTDCEKCPFKTICRMRYIIKRLPFDEDGLGLCPKLPKRLRVEAGILLRDGPKHCPIMEAKRKGL